jgi:hypothetical protein
MAQTPPKPMSPGMRQQAAGLIPLTVKHMSDAYAKLYEKLYGALGVGVPAQTPKGR